MLHKQATKKIVGLRTLFCLFETSLAMQSGVKPRWPRTGDPFALVSVVQEMCHMTSQVFLWPFMKIIVSAIIVVDNLFCRSSCPWPILMQRNFWFNQGNLKYNDARHR